MTRKEAYEKKICISCKAKIHVDNERNQPGALYSAAGIREYNITAIYDS